MPKTTLKYNSKEEIPAALAPFAKDDNSVEVWANNDDTAVAAELNPSLEQNRNTILTEKQNLQLKYDALLKTASSQDIDTAKIVAENERLKKTSVPAEDVEIAKTVKTLFPNLTQPAELKTQIETLKTQAATGVQFSEKERQTQIAKALGIKNVDYFNDVVQIPGMFEGVKEGLKGLSQEMVQEGDKQVPKVYATVIKADGTEAKVLFSEYQKTNPKWVLHQPTLMQGQTEPDNKGWIPQTGGEGDTGGGKGLVGSHITKANETATKVANPFMVNAPQTAQVQGAGQPPAFSGVKQN